MFIGAQNIGFQIISNALAKPMTVCVIENHYAYVKNV
jgi:hypothetical protein